MFKRLKVRTKLLVMALPLTVVLVVMSGLGVSERIAERAAANRHLAALSLSAQTANLVHELQSERLLASLAAASGSDDVSAQLATQRGATDEALNRLDAELDGFVGETLGGGEVGRALETIRSLRAATVEVRDATARQTPLSVVEQYSRLIERATRTAGSVEFSDEAGGANASVVSRRWLAQIVEAESSLTAVGAGWYQQPLTIEAWTALTAESRRLAGASELFVEMFAEHGTPEAVDRLASVRASEEFVASDAAVDFISSPPAEVPDGAPFPDEPLEWAGAAGARTDALVAVEREAYLGELATLEATAVAVDREATWFAAAAAIAILGVALLSLAVSRSITRSIRKLSRAAHTVSSEQVPALLESLRSPTLAEQGIESVEVDLDSSDEFGEVAAAIEDLSGAIVEVASEQHRQLRRGISDIFVNLARRNQSLLDRQIQFIDRLETNEEDPDQLENLFRLDHLATRMRRNAESLLVLAGAEAPRRRARNVEIGDVIRVAIGEVEDFARIDLIAVEPAIALGSAAVDVAHLLAEIMENGAQYSPPETTVDVVGRAQPDGGYSIVISDHGVGMSDERLANANELLRNPPPVGLAMSRSLGFVVAGTLAQRHGITVTLRPGVDAGVVAEVSLPATLLAEPTVPLPQPETRELPSRSTDGVVVPIRPGSLNLTEPIPPGKGIPGPPPIQVPPAASDAFAPPADERLIGLEHVETDQPVPSRLQDRLPEGEAFDAGLAGLLGRPVETLDGDPAELRRRTQQRDGGEVAQAQVAEPLAGAEGSATSDAAFATPDTGAVTATDPSAPTAATPPPWTGTAISSDPTSPIPPSPAGGPGAPVTPSAPSAPPGSVLPPVVPTGAAFDPAFRPADDTAPTTPRLPGVPLPGTAPLSSSALLGGGGTGGVLGGVPVTPMPADEPLPSRQPGRSTPRTAITPMTPGEAIAPRRAEVDARSALTRYRSGLRTGRNDAPSAVDRNEQGEPPR